MKWGKMLEYNKNVILSYYTDSFLENSRQEFKEKFGE